LLNGTIPIKLNASQSILYLILLSIFAFQANEGDEFI